MAKAGARFGPWVGSLQRATDRRPGTAKMAICDFLTPGWLPECSCETTVMSVAIAGMFLGSTVMFVVRGDYRAVLTNACNKKQSKRCNKAGLIVLGPLKKRWGWSMSIMLVT